MKMNRMLRKGIWMLFLLLITGLFYNVGMVGAAKSTSTEPDQGMTEEIYDSIPLEEVEEVLQELKGEEIDFSIREYVGEVLRGEGELSLPGIRDYVGNYVVSRLENSRSTLVRLILYAVLSGIFLNFSSSMYEKQMGETAFYIIYFLTVTTMVTGFFSATAVAGKVLEDILKFMNALVPSFSVALTWSSGSATSMAFYQAALSAIAVVENVLIKFFLPAVQIYFLVSILNPLSEFRFTKFTSLVRGIIRGGMKIILAVLIGHQGIQGLIMPALDSVKRSRLFQTASSMPGVGNLFGGVTDTVISTGVLIKSAIGVGGLAAVCIICILPLLKLGTFTVLYRGLSAFTQPVTDKRLVAVFQSTADSGKLLLYIVCMTALMFLITLTIIIAATNRII